jgi:hypothetical protein
MRQARLLPAGLLAGLLLPGCGGSLVKPTGRVVRGDAPLHTGAGEALHIAFVPLEATGTTGFDSYAAEFNGEDGTFQVKGKDGRGLPPGRYRVTLELIKGRKDAFRGRFSARNSPFTCEVTSGSAEVVLDLNQGGPPGPQKGNPRNAGYRRR